MNDMCLSDAYWISKTSQYYTDVYDHHRTLVEYKSKKQLFYWQGLRLAGESEASKTENRRWYAYEENSYAPLALIDHWHEIDKDEIVYYHTQLNGAPYALSSAQGELIFETEEYLWGNYRRPAKNQVTLLYGQPLRFQGQYFDQETGLHYNTFRYYDPETGRFTQQDPIGLAGGINLYEYTPNPLLWIDPLGWMPWSSNPDGMGHHLIPRNKANSIGLTELGSARNTPTFFPIPYESGMHEELHRAIKNDIGKVQGPWEDSAENLFEATGRNLDSVSHIRGELRIPATGKVIAKNITPKEAHAKLIKWFRSHDNTRLKSSNTRCTNRRVNKIQ
ncbi:RHS repeat-associated core domain-containing protein [Thorsellia kenyensis]|uniref:RHS repeat-associated core domain-containing protein n=1 Tax=Thorsellia kenyensis TaxID=1549888 RepID=A0ABV6CDF7_9GAMM